MSEETEGTGPLVIPAHHITVDEEGRVVISDERTAGRVKAALDAIPEDERANANFEANDNTLCANALAQCN